MAVYAVTEVKFDVDNERVIQAKMGAVIVKGAEWMAAPGVVDVMDVVNAILAGDDVFTVFQAGGNAIPGPKLNVVAYADGAQGVAIDGPDTPGMTLRDLPQF